MHQTRLSEVSGRHLISRPASESFQVLPPSVLAWICPPNQALFTAAYMRLGSRGSPATQFTSEPRKNGPSTDHFFRSRERKTNAPFRVPTQTAKDLGDFAITLLSRFKWRHVYPTAGLAALHLGFENVELPQ